MRNLTSFLVIPIFAFIFAAAVGAVAPSISFAQDLSKPECPPPDILLTFPGMTDLSALNAILKLPAVPENKTGHMPLVGAPAPDLGAFDAAFRLQAFHPKPPVSLGFLGNEYISASVMKEKDLDKVFKQLAADQMIPFQYPKDGCYARAEEMTRLLEKDGITAVKVFITGKLEVQTPNSPTGKVDWWYHVAPVVLVEKSGKYIPMVIDPSIFDHPVSVDEWKAIQTQAFPDEKASISYRDRFTYLPKADAQDEKPHFLNEDLQSSAAVMIRYMQLELQSTPSP